MFYNVPFRLFKSKMPHLPKSVISAMIFLFLIYLYVWNDEQNPNESQSQQSSFGNVRGDNGTVRVKVNKKHRCVPEETILRHKKVRPTSVPKIYRERESRIRDKCRKYGIQDDPVPVDYENFVAEARSGLLYCMVYKVASTNWLKMLMLLSKMDPEIPEQGGKERSENDEPRIVTQIGIKMSVGASRFGRYGRNMEVEAPAALKFSGKARSPLKAFDYFSPFGGANSRGKGIRQTSDHISMLDAHYHNQLYAGHSTWEGSGCFRNMSEHFVTFAFSRHPFERLVSAYLDKFTLAAGNMNRFYQIHLGTFIVSQFRPNATKASKVLGHDVTFPEFIEYVLYENDKTRHVDKLWRPFSRLCSPCQIQYDILGRYESFVDDKNYVLKMAADRTGLGFGQLRVLFPTLRHDTLMRRTRTSSRVVMGYLKMLGSDKRRSLVDMYMEDFKVLGYKYKKYL